MLNKPVDRRYVLGVTVLSALSLLPSCSRTQTTPKKALNIEAVTHAISDLNKAQITKMSEQSTGLTIAEAEPLFKKLAKDLYDVFKDIVPVDNLKPKDLPEYLKRLNPELEKINLKLTFNLISTGENKSFLHVGFYKIEERKDLDLSIFKKMNLPVPKSPKVWNSKAIAETDHFIGNDPNDKALEHGVTLIDPKSDAIQILIFTDNISNSCNGDPAVTELTTQSTIANELGNYYFQTLVGNEHVNSTLKGIVSVTQISEAFSDLFSLQTGLNPGFKLEVLRINSAETDDYKFSRSILINALTEYGKETGKTLQQVGDFLVDPENIKSPEMDKLREAVINSYFKNSAIQAAIKGTLKEHLVPKSK